MLFEKTIQFPGTLHQLDQLLMRIGPYSGHWTSTHPGNPKVFAFSNEVRLTWHARQKRIRLRGEDLRLVEGMAAELTRVMKRYGFMEDPRKAAKLLRDLLLKLSLPAPAPRSRPEKATLRRNEPRLLTRPNKGHPE